MALFYIKEVYEISDRFKRNENQDRCFSFHVKKTEEELSEYYIGAVIDGVSSGNGKAACRIAASAGMRQTAEGLGKLLGTAGGPNSDIEENVSSLLKSIILSADSALASKENHYATMSIAAVIEECVVTANIGDSPIYLIRETSDQSLELCDMFFCHNEAGRMLRDGEINEADALSIPERNALTRALGDGIEEWTIPTYCKELTQENVLLLGSDGALSVFPKSKIKQLVAEALEEARHNGASKPMEEFCRRLFHEAMMEENATDNFTIIAVHIGL